MPYTEKYQPQSLGQCLFPDQAAEDLIKDFAANFTAANLVLYGPMGICTVPWVPAKASWQN